MSPIVLIYKCIRKIWNILYHPYCHIYTLIVFKSNKVQYGKFHSNGIPIINTDCKSVGRIAIGNNLRMNNRNAANNIGFTSPCILSVIGGASILIGDNVGISQTAIRAVDANITIGRNTQLGGGVKIYSSDFHSMNYIDRRDPEGADKNNRKSIPVVIGEDCFIGAGTIILKGVTIGNRTTIGAGSVVTKSIPADCIAAGNPCRIIKQINL